MKKKNYTFGGIVIIFMAACSTEELIPLQKLPQLTTKENVFADMLLQSLKQQNDIWEYTQQQTMGKTLLFDYTTFSISKNFGEHYSIPYKASLGKVEGCFIYQVDSDKSNKNLLSPQSTLNCPIVFDKYGLSEIPYDRRDLSSAKFKGWKKEGLSISENLTSFADSVDIAEQKKLKPTTRNQILNPDFINFIGDALQVNIDFEMIQGYKVVDKVHGIEIITLSEETICTRRNRGLYSTIREIWWKDVHRISF